MSTLGLSQASFQDDNFATRKPLRIRFVMKQRQPDRGRTDREEVPTREDASEEAAPLEESSCSSSFRGLPCWSITARRGRKIKQSAAPTERDNEDESDTSTQSTNTSKYRAKGKSIMIPEVDTGMLFPNSKHNAAAAAELQAGHQNGNMATSSKKEEDKSCKELEIKLAVNISNKDAKGKCVMSPIFVVSDNTWSETPIQNISDLSSTTVNKKRKRRGLEIENTSEGNGSKECYVCNIRDESFSTHQALGGHKTFHTDQNKSGPSADAKLPHQCGVCDKSFQTGQKLGGHMRAHFKGTLSSKRAKRNAQDHGSSSATAVRRKSPDGSSSQCVNDIASPVDATAASSLVVTEMVLRPHDFDLNELPREEDTPAAHVMVDLTLSL